MTHKSDMKFVPLPQNDFAEFIETYYNECRQRMPQIEAIAGKWRFEDLRSGMSDFDTRFICANNMSADDWCRMSMIVGQVHLDLCEKYPKWARKLEHPPGINLTWDELRGEKTYYPEYKQWTFYHCSEPESLKQVQDIFSQRPWDIKDEYFHLKKFLTYYGPYDRSIDPGANLGLYSNRYPLHSRLMHYFAPPVQSAVSIIRQKPVKGKMETFQLAGKIFKDIDIFDEVIEIVQKNYELPHLYQEPDLFELEARLFKGLKTVVSHLRESITVLPGARQGGPDEWRQAIKKVAVEPSLKIFDHAKFARLMKGRLYFYTHVPLHFDSLWFLQVELSRIGNMFFRVPFGTFWEITRGEKMENPADIVPQLNHDILTEKEVECTLAFDRLTQQVCQGREKEIAGQIAEIYDGFFHALYKISTNINELKGM